MPDNTAPISLAQWSLVEEFRAGQWKNLDFPSIARKDFQLGAIEFVNTFFELPTERYLLDLKHRASEEGVTMVLIMVDDEGDGAGEHAKERRQFAVNHHKWVDIAAFLGCSAIRTNCRGTEQMNKREALHWAEESYRLLLDYASPAGIKVLIENHGGLSNDPDWMVDLMERINHPFFGTYPDWRSPAPEFDNLRYLQKTVPYAGGMSYRNQPTESLTAEMISICVQAGYKGWYGIESGGREAIRKGISLLNKYLSGIPA